MKEPRGTRMTLATDAGDMPCYTVSPETPGDTPPPALVLLQEIFGTNLHIRELADQWADAGFRVIVPDLFWRIEPGVELGYDGDDLERARAIYARLDWDLAAEDVMTCVAALRAEGHDRVGLLGFCFGGKLATICATRPGLDAAVGYYGVGIEKLGIAGKVACPLMLHFGAEDKGTPPEAIAELRRQLPEGTPVFAYEGAGHGFNNWRKAAYDAPSAQRAFARSLTFLRKILIDGDGR
ncbi:dienelactone hydrolase family protein [Stappia sp.]|uniref:dienelactone hydrolase family protein n=1 Tax=Stappia sp. TaxID=1870903 RepID=UPI0032D97A99